MLAYSFENRALHPIKRRETEPAEHCISKRLSRNAYGCHLLTEHPAIGINWESLPVCWSPNQETENSIQLNANQTQMSWSVLARISGNRGSPRAAKVCSCRRCEKKQVFRVWFWRVREFRWDSSSFFVRDGALDFVRVFSSLVGMRRKSELNLTSQSWTLVWERHLNIKFKCWFTESCWSHTIGLGAKEQAESPRFQVDKNLCYKTTSSM